MLIDPPQVVRGPAISSRSRDQEGGHLRGLDLSRCFTGFEAAQGLVLAVSGGPDSMALLLMTARWASGLGAAAPPVHVATVDHGLRPEAEAEAAFVAKVAADLGLPHATLIWDGPKPATRIQERARAARYALLSRYAKACGATHVLTAHHADDQAETILFRLGRGSGIGGLAGMRRVSTLDTDVVLVRPLLEVAKRDLIALCRAECCAFVEDPSNHQTSFARPRLRAAAPVLADLGLDTQGLARLGRRMTRADAAIEAETDRIEAALRPQRTAGEYRVDLSGIGGIAAEIVIRLIGRGVAQIAGTGAIRLERLEVLADHLWQAREAHSPYRSTLAGTRIVLDRHGILVITPEFPRRRGRRTDHAETAQVLTTQALRPN